MFGSDNNASNRGERLSLQTPTPTYWWNRFLGTFRVLYEAKPVPSPGAGNYAYESLGLAMFAPAGRGVSVTGNPRPLQPAQLYQQKTAAVQGIPVVAGQIIMQPLAVPPGSGG